ncbi:hypothetical protein [Oryzomonas rubra]|uniref:Lipoprotein n=1 Tax=Oryzomonas rubra TaxID=2509454 RepID=A0A5A9X8W4_9BACT|nr:hypothetical protein [Oryzomonas rubra]KAA0888071.1 hypothetical protein ET418_16865 [Oryzomonas rubra]
MKRVITAILAMAAALAGCASGGGLQCNSAHDTLTVWTKPAQSPEEFQHLARLYQISEHAYAYGTTSPHSQNIASGVVFSPNVPVVMAVNVKLENGDLSREVTGVYLVDDSAWEDLKIALKYSKRTFNSCPASDKIVNCGDNKANRCNGVQVLKDFDVIASQFFSQALTYTGKAGGKFAKILERNATNETVSAFFENLAADGSELDEFVATVRAEHQK